MSCINNGHRALAQGEGETMLPAVPLDVKLALDLAGLECTCIKAHVHEGSCGMMSLIARSMVGGLNGINNLQHMRRVSHDIIDGAMCYVLLAH